ncbi:MAG: hypothetical protein JRI87_08500 [Deltaproteobacteria bacterium]|nr:hypothetical protein [Deltaproteobacteria bacterium]
MKKGYWLRVTGYRLRVGRNWKLGIGYRYGLRVAGYELRVDRNLKFETCCSEAEIPFLAGKVDFDLIHKIKSSKVAETAGYRHARWDVESRPT